MLSSVLTVKSPSRAFVVTLTIPEPLPATAARARPSERPSDRALSGSADGNKAPDARVGETALEPVEGVRPVEHAAARIQSIALAESCRPQVDFFDIRASMCIADRGTR